MKEFKPLKFKYKKYHNRLIIKKLKKKEFKHFKLYIGVIGLKIIKSGVITSNQLKTYLKIITKYCKKKESTILFYCFPNISLTSKSIGVRMGKGMGNIVEWIFVIKKNTIFLEINAKKTTYLKICLKKCQLKLPWKTQIIEKLPYTRKWQNFKI